MKVLPAWASSHFDNSFTWAPFSFRKAGKSLAACAQAACSFGPATGMPSSEAGGGWTSKLPSWIAVTNAGMPLAALTAAMIVGIRITATITPPRSIAARPGFQPFASSFSCKGLKQMARMIVHKSSPTKGISS